ncbi:MAG: 3,4-dihydroxy-2-butanone-4-phosphate synthase [Bdellovibrionales bacterium]|nr:3,4-dihydroxy-2-butanone-4-phosphate synthase [Bdellovibrionales bacterium]
MPMHSAKELIEDIRNGKMVILVDDEDRENEGDLVLAADFVTPQAINFMAKEARGLICLALSAQQIEQLGIPLMVGDHRNNSPNKTAFTVSIEAASGVSTGISAADRAHTIRVASNPSAKPLDVIMPGHIFPIRAQRGGVLKRAGHTEGSVDLARLAGLNSAAVICEIMREDGTMARLPDLKEFAQTHGLKIGTIEDLIRYRLENETLIEEVASAPFPNVFSDEFRVRVFKNLLDGSENIVIQKGEIEKNETTLVRVQVENVLGDVFHGGGTDSGSFMQALLETMAKADRAVLIYLRKEGRSSLVADQVHSFGKETKANAMDTREYGIGAQILRALGVTKMNLIAQNRPDNAGLKGFGLEICELVRPSLSEAPANENHPYILN